MPLKAYRTSIQLPAELREEFATRWQELGYPSFPAYMAGLALYDLWSKRPHKLTAQLMKEPPYIRDKVIAELKALYNDPDETKTRPGGWFERELTRLLEEEKKKAEEKERSELDSKQKKLPGMEK